MNNLFANQSNQSLFGHVQPQTSLSNAQQQQLMNNSATFVQQSPASSNNSLFGNVSNAQVQQARNKGINIVGSNSFENAPQVQQQLPIGNNLFGNASYVQPALFTNYIYAPSPPMIFNSNITISNPHKNQIFNDDEPLPFQEQVKTTTQEAKINLNLYSQRS